MPELLLELFSEEIPARFQSRAAADLRTAVNQHLLDAGFLPEAVEAFATPRRLVVSATGLPAVQPDRREERKGPRVGAPEKAVEGFLRAAGLSNLDACDKREDAKGAYWVALIEQKGRATAEIVAAMVPELVRGFSWQKSMRWGDGDLRWVRPLHSILCAFDGEIVHFDIDGIASGDTTFGHRFLAPAAIRARNFEDYSTALRAAKVILPGPERAERIAGEARTLCEAQGLELVDDAGLLSEVAGLAEWPVAMIGSFDAKFLALPDEVLTASMRGHQKYFSVSDPRAGRLTNRFVFVANIEAPDGGVAMRRGYERVLTARLSDAWYLYNHDLAKPLETRVVALDRVTFFEGLGTLGDKARRIASLAGAFAPACGADPESAIRAGRLAKADLTAGMVYEFPELQGVMGRYYRLAEAPEDRAVADALRDHYRPVGADDAAPSAPVSIAVALADKLDTLAAFWSAGKKPTGSGDPFALRRAALGVIRIILDNGVRLDLLSAINAASAALAQNGVDADDLLGFLHDRLKVYLRERGRRHDRIDAVARRREDGALEVDLVRLARKLDALDAFLASDDGANLAAGYKRATNILKAEEKKGPVPGADAIDVAQLVEPAERALAEALAVAAAQSGHAAASEDFADALAALARLRPAIDAFFETVTVNAEDARLRRNRLSLLNRFRNAAETVADFSRLEG